MTERRMTPRAQELLAKLREARALHLTGLSGNIVETKVRERVIVEKFDHEQAETPVLIETVELVLENGRLVDRIHTTHEPPSPQGG